MWFLSQYAPTGSLCTIQGLLFLSGFDTTDLDKHIMVSTPTPGWCHLRKLAVVTVPVFGKMTS